MAKGRKNLPDQIKTQRGTDQKSRMKGASIFEPINKLPPPPPFLNKEGKKVFKNIGKYLLDLKVLNPANIMAFSALSREFGIYWEAEIEMVDLKDRWEESIDKNGNKTTSPSAKHRISKEALVNAMRLAVEFGLTPASMSKIAVQPEKKNTIDNLLD